ncbi:type IV pilin protein [Thiobacillus sedimenti]|uniref:Type IV pilin protein n=1 Tax=Thiobacillus sedimenti TaxID=3110231 RepID=A0ABZ1CG77_9PROT|nr:type IV pilin protein [Thiobacillus sp. SCUT-2]WRS38386.1 type IV pilin protein [Thiobacillus sp. SCUT-2]
MNKYRNFPFQSGVTLIELLVVVMIIGILAAVGYPSYVDHVRRAKRADAQAIMTEDAQFMERYFTTNGTYVGATLTGPQAQSPKNGPADYNITLPNANLTATGYVIQATPTGTFSDPQCGTLTIDQTGTRTESGTGTVADCWRS